MAKRRLTHDQFKVIEYLMEGGRSIQGFTYFAQVSRTSASAMICRVGESLEVEGRPDLRKIADKVMEVLKGEI